MTDWVNHPPHYQGDIECIDAIEACMTDEAFMGYLKGSVFKYLWRFEHKNPKNPREDIEKALWFLNKLHNKLPP